MMEIRATSQPGYEGHGIEIRILDHESRCFALPITMKRSENGEYIPPALTVSPEVAQKLMNSLWECGLRPAAAAGSAGQLTATEKHLDDMRRIAFGCLKETVGC